MARKHVHPMDRLHARSSTALATLAAQTGILMGARALLQDYVMKKVKGMVSINNVDAGDPAVIFGLASGDLSLAEIEAYLELAILRQGDLPAAEINTRPIQLLCAVGPQQQTCWLDARIVLPTFQEDIGFVFFIYNPSTSAFTTGAEVTAALDCFGRWL